MKCGSRTWSHALRKYSQIEFWVMMVFLWERAERRDGVLLLMVDVEGCGQGCQVCILNFGAVTWESRLFFHFAIWAVIVLCRGICHELRYKVSWETWWCKCHLERFSSRCLGWEAAGGLLLPSRAAVLALCGTENLEMQPQPTLLLPASHCSSYLLLHLLIRQDWALASIQRSLKVSLLQQPLDALEQLLVFYSLFIAFLWLH